MPSLILKRRSVLSLAGANLLVVLMILLPFLPGPPNLFVSGISWVAQWAGFAGLLLVPVALVWCLMQLRNSANATAWKFVYWLALAVTVFCAATSLLLTAAVTMTIGVGAGIAAILTATFALVPVVWGIRMLRSDAGKAPAVLPLLLLTIPLVALLTRLSLMEPASAMSRNAAIAEAQPLIAAIEMYYATEEHYPHSLEALAPRYIDELPGPFVMGILHYRYNAINNHYSLSFSQWLELGSLEELVLYDKSDLRNTLRGTRGEFDYTLDLQRVKGAFASFNTGYEHWRYYWLD